MSKQTTEHTDGDTTTVRTEAQHPSGDRVALEFRFAAARRQESGFAISMNAHQASMDRLLRMDIADIRRMYPHAIVPRTQVIVEDAAKAWQADNEGKSTT